MEMYTSLPQWGKGDRVAVDEASYVSPEIEILNLNNRDIITDSKNQGPDETTKIDNPGGIWDLNNNA